MDGPRSMRTHGRGRIQKHAPRVPFGPVDADQLDRRDAEEPLLCFQRGHGRIDRGCVQALISFRR